MKAAAATASGLQRTFLTREVFINFDSKYYLLKMSTLAGLTDPVPKMKIDLKKKNRKKNFLDDEHVC